VSAGKPERSEIYNLLVTHDDKERMPKKADSLSASEIALIKQWIADGAKFDGVDRKQLLSDMNTGLLTVKTPDKYPSALPITALAASPDGKQLAISGYGEVMLWDLNLETFAINEDQPDKLSIAPTLSARVQHMPERVLSLVWSKVNHLLAVAGGTPGRGGAVWLVDAAKHQPVKRILTTPDTVTSLARNREGNMLVVGGTDNHVRLYELPSAKLRWDVEGHADWITSLCISPDGEFVASASRDRTARLFKVGNGEIKTTYTNHDMQILSLVFDNDGRQLFSGDAGGSIRRWNREAESDKSSTTRPTREGVVQMLQAHGRTFAAFGNGRLVEMDVPGKKATHSFEVSTAQTTSLTSIEEPALLISGDRDGVVWVHELKGNTLVGKWSAVP
jgi:WD40 repeat protein